MIIRERITDPTAEPVTLDMAKNQCNVELAETFFDPWFGSDSATGDKGVIASARDLFEKNTNLSLMPQQWKLCLTDWDNFRYASSANVTSLYYNQATGNELQKLIDLMVHPAQSIESVKYYDNNNVLQTFDAAKVQIRRRQFRSGLELVNNATVLPSPFSQRTYPIEIVVNAGYSLATADVKDQRKAVPRCAIMAMLLLIGHWFKNREAVGTISKEIELGYCDLVRAIKPERYS